MMEVHIRLVQEKRKGYMFPYTLLEEAGQFGFEFSGSEHQSGNIVIVHDQRKSIVLIKPSSS